MRENSGWVILGTFSILKFQSSISEFLAYFLPWRFGVLAVHPHFAFWDWGRSTIACTPARRTRMAVSKFLAFDLGAESGRAVLGTLEGKKLSLEEKHRFANPYGKMSGRLQWNLLAQWEELKTGLRKVAPDVREAGGLSGIGVDTWGVDVGFLTKSGEILGNPMVYRDPATDGMMERAFAKVSREKIFQATGIQFMRINTLYQLVAMRQRDSQVLQMADTMLFMPDLYNYLLCGTRRCEMSIASTSQMFDPRRKQWATELLQALDIPTGMLAEIIPSGSVVGRLLTEVADECGIRPAPVIAPGCHDTASAVAAVPADGARSDDWCYISSGTWSLMGVELNEPIVSDKALQYNYTNEMGVGGKVRFLKNIMGLWLVQECRRQWQRQGYDHSYGELTAMAGRAPAFGSLIDPNHGPFLTPGEMIEKIDRFCTDTQQRTPGSRGEYVRTCLESLALAYRKTVEGLEDIVGKKIRIIHIVGGGAQNELLNQMTANACNRVVLAGPVEATAAGNILVQAMAVNDVESLEAARAVVRESFDVKRYEPQDVKKWDAAYERYSKIVER
jgi:sugar (pentulose or hexulose) kinase